jgi:type II secretory ATPase GspE/PulE/Tfp pilus assembly ATPase PilB-like protein
VNKTKINQNNNSNELSNVPKIDLKTLDLKRETGKILSEDISRKIDGIVIGVPDEQTLVIAVKDPEQIYIYDTVSYITRHKYHDVKLLQADPEFIDLAIEYVYNLPKVLYDKSWKEWLEQKKFSGQKLNLELKQDSTTGKPAKEVTGSVIDKANQIIIEAISVGASDIHLETYDDSLAVRYRIDGVLHIVDVIQDLAEARALVKRIKIMANMDIAQDRVTQGGRISVKVADKAFDLRISIVPVPSGESIVMRLLNKGAFDMSLETLGFDEQQLKIYRRMISHPYGIILCCGPTGSGKSTTLYASLKEINRPDRKLLTVEDPIEYQMPGIVQVQVNLAPREEEKKVTFAKALREFLRQDPDVILVGEIRDEETASISVKAAQTGHLVFSTIHTNDAVGIINRLKDMNVVPYLISDTLIGGIGQRLVRKLCPSCRQPAEYPEDFKEIIEKNNIKTLTFFKSTGCDNCRKTGYRGRLGLYEMLVVDEEIRDMIETGATRGEIQRKVRMKGMKTLLEDGVLKASQGITSPGEVKRVCMMDIT